MSDQQTQTQHLRNLIVMAVADGSLGQREVHLIADRCVELGLSESDLQSAISYAMQDDASLSLPAGLPERQALMKDLIRVMAADGHLAETEKRLFALAAARMNLTGEKLDALINEVTAEAP